MHAAALKHVDLSEREPTEYVSINTLGSLTVAKVARALKIPRVIGISTDKSCSPHNVYGWTKLLMERMFREHGYVSVRYGNVFASDGSVIPRWTRQLRDGGEIVVTDPLMTRFFFPIEEAVQAVLWTRDHAPAGSVVVPRLSAASLGDLATAFLAGRQGRIVVAGPRPGEKRHEQLINEDEGRTVLCDGAYVLLMPPSTPGTTQIPALTSDTAPRLSVDHLRAWLAHAVEVAA